jgi:glycosyltransferase involved in cell wall biosynthesis
MKKNILIITTRFPNYGGYATNAYKMLKLLTRNGFNVRLVYANSESKEDIDPDKTGMSHRIELLSNPFNSVRQWLRIDSDLINSLRKKLSKLYLSHIVRYRLIEFQRSIDFVPDLIISNSQPYFEVLQQTYQKKKYLFIVGGSAELTYLAEHDGTNAQTFLNKEKVSNNFINDLNTLNQVDTTLVFNSELTLQIFIKKGLKSNKSIVQYINFVSESTISLPRFSERRYALIFIASNFMRKIKNIDLAYEVFRQFPDVPKLAIGRGSQHFESLPNTQVRDLTSQHEIMMYLSDSKLLLIPSYFDSSPGVMAESIRSGCNVLISKNVGWHTMLDQRSVVENYTNKGDWIQKAAYLTENYVSNSTLESLIANAESDLIQRINSNLINGCA